MKKQLPILVLFAILTTHASDFSRIDVRAGLALSNYQSGDIRDYEAETQRTFHPVLGPSVDVGFRFQKSELFSLQPELKYTILGSHLTVDDTTSYLGQPTHVVGDFTDRLHYLEVPLLCGFSFPGTQVEWSANIGPYAGIRLAAVRNGLIDKTVVANGIYSQEVHEDNVINDGYWWLNFGMLMGGSMAIPLENNALLVDLRYNLGLLLVTEYEGVTVKTGTLTLTVGYGFGMKR